MNLSGPFVRLNAAALTFSVAGGLLPVVVLGMRVTVLVPAKVSQEDVGVPSAVDVTQLVEVVVSMHVTVEVNGSLVVGAHTEGSLPPSCSTTVSSSPR